jgi:hypothetical protein
MIGDIHGDLKKYVELASQAQYTVQVGDLGFDCLGLEEYLDPSRHRVVGGNHDNYTTHDNGVTFHRQPPNYLGDYGVLEFPGVPKIFYMRGARSVDRDSRNEGQNWWPLEELTYQQHTAAIQAYVDAKPDIVITHECPAFLVNEVTRWKVPLRPSNTAHACEAMFSNYEPPVWIFGHFHHDWSFDFRSTHFRCLDIKTTYDMDRPFIVNELESHGKITSLNLGGK